MVPTNQKGYLTNQNTHSQWEVLVEDQSNLLLPIPNSNRKLQHNFLIWSSPSHKLGKVGIFPIFCLTGGGVGANNQI